MAPARLTEGLWASIEDVYAAILAHPFVAGLADGSLERESFRFYVVQDSHYLREYARALSLLSARAHAEGDILMFSRHAAAAIEVERSLHESFFRDLSVGEHDVSATPMSPTNVAYTSYLLAACYGGSFAEGLGAVLPCYWIYWKVGTELLARSSPDPLYRRWIDTYGGEEFGEIVQAVLDLADRIAPGLGSAERERLGEHFVQTSRFEWMFWEAGYRRESWPI